MVVGLLVVIDFNICLGSMEPGVYRGDLVFLHLMDKEKVRAGDVTVYQLPRKQIPIVHRIVHSHRLVVLLMFCVFFLHIS